MQKKYITCIRCPKGCKLEVEAEGDRVVKVTGNQCEKGISYAEQEIENPERTFTSSVLAEGLEIKMIPVRTNRPIPKGKILDGMAEIRKIKINHPVKINDIIAKDFLGLNVELIATREALTYSIYC